MEDASLRARINVIPAAGLATRWCRMSVSVSSSGILILLKTQKIVFEPPFGDLGASYALDL